MGQCQFSRLFAESFDIHQAISSAMARLSTFGAPPTLADIVSVVRREHPEIMLSLADLELAIVQAAANGGMQIRAEESSAA